MATKTVVVGGTRAFSVTMEVEADTDSEACEIAGQTFDTLDWDSFDWAESIDYDDITVLKEENV